MKTKKILSIALAAAMTLSLGLVSTAVYADEIVINYPTFQVGSNSAAPVVAELVNEFNETYAGQYKIVVEDVPGDQNYADKIKVQITSGQLPPVVYGAGSKLLDMALGADLVIRHHEHLQFGVREDGSDRMIPRIPAL